MEISIFAKDCKLNVEQSLDSASYLGKSCPARDFQHGCNGLIQQKIL